MMADLCRNPNVTLIFLKIGGDLFLRPIRSSLPATKYFMSIDGMRDNITYGLLLIER